MAFDPNQYLSQTSGFDPDQYIAQTAQAAPNQGTTRNGFIDMAANAIKQTPLGMAAQTGDMLSSGLSKVMNAFPVPVSPGVQKFVSNTLDVPRRLSRAAGVGLVNAPQAMSFGGSPTAGDALQAGNRMQAAFAPMFQPADKREQYAAKAGEMASYFAPGFAPAGWQVPLASIQNAAAQTSDTGKFGAVGLAAPILAELATPVARSILAKGTAKVLPPLLKSTKGVPLEATKMGLEDPSIMQLPGNSGSIQGKSQAIIDAIKEANRKVGQEHAQAYAEQGMQTPMQQIINSPTEYRSQIGNRNYQVEGDLIRKTQSVPGYSYETSGNPVSRGIDPSEVSVAGTGQRVDVPGRSYTYTETGPNKTISAEDVVGTAPVNAAPKTFNDLRSDYHSAMTGDLFKTSNTAGGLSEMGDREKLSLLTDLKRSLQDKAIYPQPGQQLSPSQGAMNGAIKKMAADIDALRGTVPGGDKLALADDAYHEMTELTHRLMGEFRDPYKGQDYLNRLLKGNTDWLTSGRNAGKMGAIERIEEITGKDVLKPALREIAATYLKNPDVLSLPGFDLKSIIGTFIPTEKLISLGSKLSGRAATSSFSGLAAHEEALNHHLSANALEHSRGENRFQRQPIPLGIFGNEKPQPQPLFRKAS